MDSREFDYDLFFSYRHRPLDTQITTKLFNLAESYRLPASIRKAGGREIRRAFRDTEELQVSRVLTETIDKALRSTNCLVVVCSTDTPSSDWVDREVATFIELGRAEHVYPILISGDPEVSFPPSLKKIPNVTDRLMDIRCPGNPVKKMMERADTEMLRVIADIAGCEEAELIREHAFRRRKKRFMNSAAAIGIMALITAVSFGLLRMAQDYRDSAALHAEASLRILQELTYDLPDHLTNIPGAYSRIADILEENTEDIGAILRLSRDREKAEYEAAANYEKLANARSVLGMYDEALLSEDTAAEIFRALLDGGYEKGLEALASSYSNRGNILHSAGRYEAASEAYEEAAALLRNRQAEGSSSAGTDVPSGDNAAGSSVSGETALLLAQIRCNAGANALDLGDGQQAANAFSESLAILREAGYLDTEGTAAAGASSGAAPAEQPERGSQAWKDAQQATETGALACYNYGVLLYRSGKYAEARQYLEDSCLLYSLLLENTDSLQNRGSYLRAASALATCLTDEGYFEEADAYFVQAIDLAKELARDGENLTYQRVLADLYNNRGLCFNIRGDYHGAEPLYEEAADCYRMIYEKTGAPSDGAVYAVAILNTGENAFKAGEYERSESLFSEGLSVFEPLSKGLGAFYSSQYHAWRSYYELIHRRNAEAAFEEGLTACNLQPDSVLANLNLAYACLYSGRYEECDYLFGLLASLGDGQKEVIRLDLQAQQAAGMSDPHVEEVLKMLEE